MTTIKSTADDAPSLPGNASQEEVNRIFRELRALNEACKSANDNDRAIILIHACIDNGLNSRRRIRGALGKLDFKLDHAVIILNTGTGGNPSRHRWYRDTNGIYHNHPVT